MIDKRSFARHELIGLEAAVVKSKNKFLIGVSGKVVDETRNTLMLESKDHITKRLLKDQVTLCFKHDHCEETIDGKILLGRPEDRLKKMRK